MVLVDSGEEVAHQVMVVEMEGMEAEGSDPVEKEVVG